jgi:hypothetical protein
MPLEAPVMTTILPLAMSEFSSPGGGDLVLNPTGSDWFLEAGASIDAVPRMG